MRYTVSLSHWPQLATLTTCGRPDTEPAIEDRPHLVRAHRNAISDAGPDWEYSASPMAFVALEIDKPMRIGGCACDSVLGLKLAIRARSP